MLITKRRGNPNWAKAGGLIPFVYEKSKWEKEVESMGLADSPESWSRSERLREWARSNRQYRYVPERLLKAWNLRLNDEMW